MKMGSIAILAACIGISGASAAAAAGDDFDVHARRASALYRSQHYEESLSELQAAYRINPLPRLLYNLGQVHRKLGHVREALESYDLFLRTDPNIQPEIRAEVRGYMDNLRAAQAAPPVDPVAQPPQAAPVAVPAAAVQVSMEPTNKTAGTRRKRPSWRWVLGGSLVAAGVTGIVLGGYALPTTLSRGSCGRGEHR